MRFILPLCFLLLLSACGADSDTADAAQEKPFFDLAGYMDSEIERLAAQPPSMQKTVTINDESESSADREIKLKNDLELFRRADINRNAWIDKYAVREEGDITSYVATDSSLSTSLLRIQKARTGEVQNIYIERRSGNILSDSKQILRYNPQEGYTMRYDQASNLVGSVVVNLEVTFQ
ncbi:MAG: hypothetical protein AAF828_02235 [Bacteroidota bacterium]